MIAYSPDDDDIKAVARRRARGQALVRPGDLGDHCRKLSVNTLKGEERSA
jgi:hypothetical protein